MNKPREISFADVSGEFDSGIAGADKLRADQLEQLVVARQAKDTGLKREQARLTKKLGADHPRVAEIAGRLKVNAGIRRDLALESARARTEIPKVDQKSWALLGIVRDKDLNGVSGVTVALYDEKGKWVEQLGYACTRDDGQFRIEPRNVGRAGGPVFLHVRSAQAVDLYVDRVPLTPAGGKIDYREITLSGNGQPCPPPEGQPAKAAGPAVTTDAWIVRGRVTDSAGKGLDGLTVSVYDKDLVFDDRLGQTKTDKNGKYLLTYSTGDFRDLIEEKPDLYVKVLDQNGEILHSSKGAIRYEAGGAEVIDIQIGKRGKK